MHLKFANHKCSHYTHINCEMMDVSNSLIVVIISQHIPVSNHHAAQLKYVLFHLSITPWWSWKKCPESRIGGRGEYDRHGTYRGKQEWEILQMNTDIIPRKRKVLEISDETWNSGESEGQTSCDIFNFINTKLALLVREDRRYWLNGTLILGIWSRSHHPWLLLSS